jgi:hypothetical protein
MAKLEARTPMRRVTISGGNFSAKIAKQPPKGSSVVKDLGRRLDAKAKSRGN